MPRNVDFHDDEYSGDDLPRPVKVARTNALSFDEASAVYPSRESPAYSQQRLEDDNQESLQQNQEFAPPRTRAKTACQTCRGRRTKCDNKRPRCGYCSRVHAKCVYLEEDSATSCQVYGPRVLDAIQDLRELIQSQMVQGNQQLHQSSNGLSPIALSQYDATSPLAQLVSYHAQGRDAQLGNSSDNSASQSSHGRWRQRPLSSQGLNSVLAWSVFKSDSGILPETWPEDDDAASNHPLTLPMPTWDVHEMGALLSRYTAGVHIKNPILDLPQTRADMCLVAENGPDWSSKTCLIALICAIGALTESNETTTISQKLHADMAQSPAASGLLTASRNQQLADRFWSVAAKRLGFAIGQNNLEAVQCLCLTGIWYMNKLQPMIAWKYFSMAGNAWYSTMMSRRRLAITEEGDELQKALRIEQSLFFTIYKSECELRVELDLPKSILEDVDMSYAFPSPPKIDNHIAEDDVHMTERTWYYYLAEIAARHIINRVLRARSRPPLKPFLSEVRRLLEDVDNFTAQLLKWHSSLPPVIFFSIAGDGDRDELTGILHMRYLTVLELLYRPFVCLCVEHDFSDVPDNIRTSVAELASRGLQCCVQKLQVPTPVVHQGSWISLRTITLCTMVLTAAHRSQRDPTFLAAAEMAMPQGWQDQVYQTVVKMNRFWGESVGGARKMKQLLDWAIADMALEVDVDE